MLKEKASMCGSDVNEPLPEFTILLEDFRIQVEDMQATVKLYTLKMNSLTGEEQLLIEEPKLGANGVVGGIRSLIQAMAYYNQCFRDLTTNFSRIV